MPDAVPPPPPFDAPVEAFDKRARARLTDAAETRNLDLADARLAEARCHGFDSWTDLIDFCSAVKADPPTQAFESAIEELVAGDLVALRRRLEADPDLVRRRSRRRHRATLLHYLGANGVEDHRQRTPANALAMARLLLDAGADVDATADLYGSPCTTLTLLISSHHPAAAGVQPDLAALLIDCGAQPTGPNGTPASAVRMALSHGYRDTARVVCSRLEPLEDLPISAGLGDSDGVRHLLDSAAPEDRYIALALAAIHGEAEIVEWLIRAGADPSRFNPTGYHAHSTPLHQAALHGHLAVVEALVDAGADLAAIDTVFGGTPQEWARHAKQTDVEAFLESRRER